MSEGQSERARERAKEGGRERMDMTYMLVVCRESDGLRSGRRY